MPVPKIEEYRAPWETEGGEDAEIDKSKLKRYIHNLLGDKDKLQVANEKLTEERDAAKTALDEKSRESETDAEKRAREAEDKGKAEEANKSLAAENLRLQVALEKGLTATQAKRLIGTSKEELEKDADDLVESFGGAGSAEGDGEVTPRRQPKRVTNPVDPDPDAGGEIDIAKAIESIPRIN